MDTVDRKCTECQRILQLSTVDKCMYCGADIPEALRLSEARKGQIRKQHETRETERKRLDKQRKQNSWGTADGGFDGSCGGDWF